MLFPLSNRPYLAAIGPTSIEAWHNDPICGAVYAPGIVCTDWRTHYDRASTLFYGYLAWVEGAWQMMGRACLTQHLPAARPWAWQSVLNQRHPLVDTDLPTDWRRQTLRKYWRVVPLIGLILQVEPSPPTRHLLHHYLARITSHRQPLTQKQRKLLWNILCERCGRPFDISRALDEFQRVLKQRRDAAFRLAQLIALDLRPTDRKTVRSLQARNTAWDRGLMRRLSDGQLGLIRALEAAYLTQRREATLALIRTLVEAFDLWTSDESPLASRWTPPGGTLSNQNHRSPMEPSQ